jgi:hypothetical protein
MYGIDFCDILRAMKSLQYQEHLQSLSIKRWHQYVLSWIPFWSIPLRFVKQDWDAMSLAQGWLIFMAKEDFAINHTHLKWCWVIFSVFLISWDTGYGVKESHKWAMMTCHASLKLSKVSNACWHQPSTSMIWWIFYDLITSKSSSQEVPRTECIRVWEGVPHLPYKKQRYILHPRIFETGYSCPRIMFCCTPSMAAYFISIVDTFQAQPVPVFGAFASILWSLASE